MHPRTIGIVHVGTGVRRLEQHVSRLVVRSDYHVNVGIVFGQDFRHNEMSAIGLNLAVVKFEGRKRGYCLSDEQQDRKNHLGNPLIKRQGEQKTP